jgi:hypothetical protein
MWFDGAWCNLAARTGIDIKLPLLETSGILCLPEYRKGKRNCEGDLAVHYFEVDFDVAMSNNYGYKVSSWTSLAS